MDAKIVDLNTLFETQVSYRIPEFQRPYAWQKEKQWKPLWDDVCKVAELFLTPEGGCKTPPHFMGAIVLQPHGGSTAEVDKRLVVDGQQRLTTLQLLIRATQEAFQGNNELPAAERLSKLTLNSQNHWGNDPNNETKIRQSNQNDQKEFQEAIRGLKQDQVAMRSIGEAFYFFKGAVTKWLDAQPEHRAARANALEETLTKHLQIAAIDLDAREKPHLIFQVLNTRGETLKQSDLIKNTVMYEADVVDDREKANSLWGMFDVNEWWRQETKEGRLRRIHLDRFLNYWVIMRAKKDVTAEHVSAEFSKYVDSLKAREKIDMIAEDVRRAGVVYSDIEKGQKPGIESFLSRMKALELGVVMPPLLWIYTNGVEEEKCKRGIQALESYLVRRMLCGMQSQGLNRLFIELLASMETSGAQTADQTIVNFLKGQTSDNRIWPRDRMVVDYLTDNPFTAITKRRQVMVLEAIEMHLRSGMSEEVAKFSSLTLEHIMPQSWKTKWPLPVETPDRAEAEGSRDQAIKKIGNLTLVNSKLNSSLSNSQWNEKKETLGQHTTLRLNLNLLQDFPKVWDETTIAERSRHLAELINKIWPFADTM